MPQICSILFVVDERSVFLCEINSFISNYNNLSLQPVTRRQILTNGGVGTGEFVECCTVPPHRLMTNCVTPGATATVRNRTGSEWVKQFEFKSKSKPRQAALTIHSALHSSTVRALVCSTPPYESWLAVSVNVIVHSTKHEIVGWEHASRRYITYHIKPLSRRVADAEIISRAKCCVIASALF